MNKNSDQKILSDLESGYDLIAEKFSGTRAFVWRDLGFLKDLVKPGDKVLDFGCGNGRLAGFLLGESGGEEKLGRYVGVDISQKLIDIAKQRYHSEKTEFIKISANAKRSDRATKEESGRTSFALPLEDNYFDIVFSIAVFHHFPSKKYALEVAKELQRVLKPGGKIIITVWNLWQKQYLKYHQKSNKEWIGAEIPFKCETPVPQDPFLTLPLLRGGKKGGVAGEIIFSRYHHPFKIGEMEALFWEAGFKKIETKKGWNLLYIGEKPKAKL